MSEHGNSTVNLQQVLEGILAGACKRGARCRLVLQFVDHRWHTKNANRMAGVFSMLQLKKSHDLPCFHIEPLLPGLTHREGLAGEGAVEDDGAEELVFLQAGQEEAESLGS